MLEHMKAAILLLTILGVTPAILLSASLVYVSLRSPNADFRPPAAKHFSLGQRIYLVSITQGHKLTVDTVLWLPLLVLLFGLAFLGAVFFMLRSQG